MMRLEEVKSRPCVTCGKIHGMHIHYRDTDECRLIDQCYDCLLSGISFKQIHLDENIDLTIEEMKKNLQETENTILNQEHSQDSA